MFQSHHRRRHSSCRRRHCTGWMKVSIATAAAMHILLSHLRTTRSLHRRSMIYLPPVRAAAMHVLLSHLRPTRSLHRRSRIYLLPVTTSQHQIHRRSGSSSASQLRGAIGGGTSPPRQQYGQTQSTAAVDTMLMDSDESSAPGDYNLLLWRGPN